MDDGLLVLVVRIEMAVLPHDLLLAVKRLAKVLGFGPKLLVR